MVGVFEEPQRPKVLEWRTENEVGVVGWGGRMAQAL